MNYTPFFIIFLIVIIGICALVYVNRERIKRWRHPKLLVTIMRYPSIEVVNLPYVKTKEEAYVFEWDNPMRKLEILQYAKIWYWRYGKKLEGTPVIDYEAGKTISITFDERMYLIRSNPDLSGQLVDATMVKEAFQLSPSQKKKIIVAAVCLLIGYTIIGQIVYAFFRAVFHV